METHVELYRRWGKLARPYFRWQFDQFLPYLGKRVADVGCGLGNFTEFLTDRDLYLGFEPDPELAFEFPALHPSDSVRLAVNGDITDSQAVREMKQNRIDSVLCVNVLEHIEDDRAALTNMVEGVCGQGHICLLVPALPSLYGTLDALDGHYRRYTKKTLSALSRNFPVKILRLYYMNFVGMFGWFLKGRILKVKAPGNEDFRLMNAVLPVVSKLEKWVPPPIGMSLVLILKKQNQE